MNLIAQHIPDSALNIPIYDVVAETGSHTVCCMTGQPLQQACLKKDVIGDNFTDIQYLRYPSAYISPDIAKLIVGKAVDGNGLRNYSFYADNHGLVILKREDIWGHIFAAKDQPFILGVTFSNKKHIAFKATPQYNSDNFRIYTDIGECEFYFDWLKPAISYMQEWYTIVPGKENSTQQSTFFTKANILGETPPTVAQIKAYGEDWYFSENKIFEKYRQMLVFKVLVFALNKKNKWL